MTILVTGSAGHLGEALVHTLKNIGKDVIGVDIKAAPTTDMVGSIADPQFVNQAMKNISAVLHTATLHKPHVATHSRQDFVDTNISGTLNLLEAALASNVQSFVYTSTTSVFGNALVPPPGEPAAWITEDVAPIPKNIYGVTKFAAENLCQMFAQKSGLPVTILRTSRFFPEEDDSKPMRENYSDDNTKANEFLCRRVEISDAVDAHILAMNKTRKHWFGRYIISATTPFSEADLPMLRTDAPAVLFKYFPLAEEFYDSLDWKMFPLIDRVYVNKSAREQLNWQPKYDFAHILQRLRDGKSMLSPLAQMIGKKRYHSQTFEDGPFPVE